MHLMHYTMVSLAHVWLIYPIGHVYVETDLEVPTEQVQVEDLTNLDLNQGKPWCINQCSLSFIFKYIFMLYFDCALTL
jgi:hypothetical protein